MTARLGVVNAQAPSTERVPRAVWRLFRFLPPRIAYAVGLGPLVGKAVLLLKTIGRKSGRPRTTPLLFDDIDGTIYVGSARGDKADWYRNILVNPLVEVTIGARRIKALAEPVDNQSAIIDFLAFRQEHRPLITKLGLRIAGLGASPAKDQLEEYARGRKLVAIHPLDGQ